MEDFFNIRCVEALSSTKNKVLPADLLKKLKKGSCYSAAQQYYLDRHYQIQKQAPLRLMEEHLKIGRKFESHRLYDADKETKNW